MTILAVPDMKCKDKGKQEKKKKFIITSSATRSVYVHETVAFLRRGATRETGSCKLQLHGNMETTTSGEVVLFGWRWWRRRRILEK